MDNQPIGILDSGVGGLSVWREIISLLPNETTIYIADQKNIPYGTKTAKEIHRLARKLVTFFLQRKVKLIVIACNVMTVTSIEKLRQDFPDIPIVGTVPVIKLAAKVSQKKKTGILSTMTTAKSEYQKKLIQDFANDCEVLNRGTDTLVPLIEIGAIEGKKIENILQAELLPFHRAGVDCLVLGCTHFPLLKKQIERIVGKDVLVLDSGAAIARQVRRVLENNNTLSARNNASYTWYTTGDAKQFATVAKKLLGKEFSDKIRQVERVSL